MTDEQQWQDRRVGSGHERAADLLANPNNWRIHPQFQQAAMSGALDSVGWVGAVKVNKRTGHLLDGHLRVQIALRKGDDTLVPVDYYDLSPEEESLVLATYDPLAGMAEQDEEKLAEIIAGLDLGEMPDSLVEMLNDLSGDGAGDDEDDDNYTRKIEAPIYEITGDRPEVSELFDDSKTQELIEEINAADIPEDIAEFLRKAAERHTVFSFSRIAEFYAHADADVQELMEKSALVIIDFDKAIEEGFIRLSKEIAAQYGIDHDDSAG